MTCQEDEIFDLRLQSNAATHDEDSNKFQATSIYTKLSIVANLRRKAPGGDSNWVRDKLIENLGRHGRLGRCRVAVQFFVQFKCESDMALSSQEMKLKTIESNQGACQCQPTVECGIFSANQQIRFVLWQLEWRWRQADNDRQMGPMPEAAACRSSNVALTAEGQSHSPVICNLLVIHVLRGGYFLIWSGVRFNSSGNVKGLQCKCNALVGESAAMTMPIKMPWLLRSLTIHGWWERAHAHVRNWERHMQCQRLTCFLFGNWKAI